MSGKPYTDQQVEFIKSHCSKMTAAQLVDALNQKFNDTRTKKGLLSFMQSHGLHTVVPKPVRLEIFTDIQKSYMQEHGPYMSRKDLTEKLNTQFNINVSVRQVKSWCYTNKIKSPNGNGRFTTETSPRWAKGLSNSEFRSHYTDKSFSNLISPMIESNKKYKMGDEIIRHDIPYIVINNDFGHGIDARIKRKSIYVWERQYGEISSKSMIIHLDNDKMNCNIENLMCIPTKYRPWFMHNSWWDAPKEIKEVAVKWCELYYALNENNLDRKGADFNA
jgi:hypothetical protein